MIKHIHSISCNCIVCRKPFEKYLKGKRNHSHKTGKYKRPNWARTCSKQCSKRYIANRSLYLKRK